MNTVDSQVSALARILFYSFIILNLFDQRLGRERPFVFIMVTSGKNGTWKSFNPGETEGMLFSTIRDYMQMRMLAVGGLVAAGVPTFWQSPVCPCKCEPHASAVAVAL